MNIFFLDPDPVKAAVYHNDKHVVKMILETAQLLSTAHHELSADPPAGIYRPTHRNHPSAVWVRASAANYLWAHKLLQALCWEYTYRYGKVHRTQTSGVVKALEHPPHEIFWGPPTPHPYCMPEDYHRDDTVSSYKAYYMGPKAHLGKWTNRKPPPWWQDQTPSASVTALTPSS